MYKKVEMSTLRVGDKFRLYTGGYWGYPQYASVGKLTEECTVVHHRVNGYTSWETLPGNADRNACIKSTEFVYVLEGIDD